MGDKIIHVVLLNEIHFDHSPSLEQFQRWVDGVVAALPEKIPNACEEVCISIIDKETSAELNERYRGKKGPTNILSFTYEPIPGIERISLGDCAICAEVVETEAATQNKSREAHWAHLTVHGILHLLSYDHIEEEDATIMEKLETELLHQLGFENPYE